MPLKTLGRIGPRAVGERVKIELAKWPLYFAGSRQMEFLIKSCQLAIIICRGLLYLTRSPSRIGCSGPVRQ
jgi:hypothetical protein